MKERILGKKYHALRLIFHLRRLNLYCPATLMLNFRRISLRSRTFASCSDLRRSFSYRIQLFEIFE